MAIIELDLLEVELTFAPKMVLFGSADETFADPAEGNVRTSTAADNGSTVDVEPNLPGIALFGLGIALAIWLGRRRIGRRRES